MVHSGDRGDIVLSSATSCPRVLVVVLLPPKSRQARAQGQLGSIHHASLADRTGPGRAGSCRVGSDRVGQDWTGPGRVGPGRTGPDWAESGRTRSGRTRPDLAGTVICLADGRRRLLETSPINRLHELLAHTS